MMNKTGIYASLAAAATLTAISWSVEPTVENLGEWSRISLPIALAASVAALAVSALRGSDGRR